MPEDYQVQAGDSVNSVAFERGFFWQTLWDHPNNARLKQTRKDPDVLLEGDILHIPDKREKQESAATRRHHRFRKRGTPAKLRLVLLRPKKPGKKSTPQAAPKWWEYHQPAVEQAQTEPDSDVPYCLYADGLIVKQGKTDQDGKIEVDLSPAAKQGLLVLHRGTPQERTLELNFRHMDPIDDLRGVAKRLNNLGFACPVGSSEPSPELTAAIQAFQRMHKLGVTGKADSETKNKLKEAYGG